MEENKQRKRKSNTLDTNQDHLDVINPRKIHQQVPLGFNDDLNLSLSTPTPLPTPPVPDIVVTPPLLVNTTNTGSGSGTTSRRGRRVSTGSTRSRSEGGGRAIVKTNAVTPPFRWATDKRATVHSMQYLVSQGIDTITGDVQCKKCEKSFEMEYNVVEKFKELVGFIFNEEDMRQRAPKAWLDPILPTCRYCGQENSCKPVISDKKRSINWLFLLLGQMLGCCTLEQLKYFCKHTQNHRTGAKDRVLFLSYFNLCLQLDPTGPFRVNSNGPF